MQVRVFAIPMEGEPDALEELNVFLRSHRVLSVEKAAVVDHGRHYWAICVEYLPRRVGEPSAGPTGAAGGNNKPRLDYREILGKDEFERFARLRLLRKQLAEVEGVPVYTILTNAQLADLARTVPQTRTALVALEGLGPAKCERYGDALLTLLESLPRPVAQEAGAVGAAGRIEPDGAGSSPATNGSAHTGP